MHIVYKEKEYKNMKIIAAAPLFACLLLLVHARPASAADAVLRGGRRARGIGGRVLSPKSPKSKGKSKKGCKTFDATWIVKELANSNSLMSTEGISAEITSAYARVCGEACEAPVDRKPQECCPKQDDFIGSMYLKESRAGNGGPGDQEEALIVDGGYILDGQQLYFQGVVEAKLHDHNPPLNPGSSFELGITGGTGKYMGAWGQITVEKPYPVKAGGVLGPARVTKVMVCGIKDDA